MSTTTRQYDFILLGATGYTGQLTATHIFKNLPLDLNWAVAGRNSSKLQSLVTELQKFNPDRAPPSIEVNDFSKPNLETLVAKARVVITTVGPFHLHGTPIIEACARAGTHYLDSTGETPWVYDVTHKYHSLARDNGTILIPHCAQESAPADLVAFLLTSAIREKTGRGTKQLVHSIQKFENDMSGGTLRSLISVAESYPFRHLKESVKPYALCDDKVTPRDEPFRPKGYAWKGSATIKGLGRLSDSVIGIPDTNLVYRSWSLMKEDYGSEFRYWTGMTTKGAVSGFFWHWMMALSLPMLLVAPLRWIMLKLVPAHGDGPSEESQSKSSTVWKSIAHSEADPKITAVCDMSFDRDMYSLTAITLSEAAMVLLRPDRENPAQKIGGGVLTPATLGYQYVERVRAAGLKVQVKIEE
ncbi:hypothetical protein DM02DRAFT_692005 [Periconia macrospinosa]|uniref:Saccharopine dehydrogenase NADP binding domain-containing protein n=1 Tax=Periconia macrospinosa TaxID=97972 RepID=A0A2V1DCH3_9PLEO|nr:hypothetical protein DM02DRAFT_692005 [Periconia macrospinosa]